MSINETISSKRQILWVALTDPWSEWTMSGISRSICLELNKRQLLFGAIGAQSGTRLRSSPPNTLSTICHRTTRFLRPIMNRKCLNSERKGVLGKTLRLLPEGTPVIYTFLTPEYDTSLSIKRFRLMDISLFDAVRVGAYGHSNLDAKEFECRINEQLRSFLYIHGIITLSSYAADSIARDFGYPRDKIVPIGAGAAVQASSLDDDTIRHNRYEAQRILFIGRDWERKGGPLLVDAFRIVKQQLPNAVLVVVGPKTRPTTEPGVEWHPPVNKETKRGRFFLADIYNSSSVFCMPSVCETWGLVYVEAAHFKLPIVGFKEWALPDIVMDTVTGILTQDRSASGLASVITEALGDPSRLARMGKAASVRVASVLDWPHVVDRMLSIVAPEFLGGAAPALMSY